MGLSSREKGGWMGGWVGWQKMITVLGRFDVDMEGVKLDLSFQIK